MIGLVVIVFPMTDCEHTLDTIVDSTRFVFVGAFDWNAALIWSPDHETDTF